MNRTAILLAAGLSRRFGRDNKLVHKVNGKPMIEIAVELLKSSQVFEQIIVVCGHESDKITAMVNNYKIEVVVCRDFAKGIAESIKCGIKAARNEVVLIVPSDMPYLEVDDIRAVALAANSCCTIATAKADDYVGVPTAFYLPSHRHELLELCGDYGAKAIVKRHQAKYIDLSAQHVVDIDTRQ